MGERGKTKLEHPDGPGPTIVTTRRQTNSTAAITAEQPRRTTAIEHTSGEPNESSTRGGYFNCSPESVARIDSSLSSPAIALNPFANFPITDSNSMSTPATKMPPPRAKTAPRFKGRNVKDFLFELETIAESVGAKREDLPKCVLSYCESDIRNRLAGEPAFKGTNWAAAKALLFSIFRFRDSATRYPPQRLRSFAAKSRKSQTVDSEEALSEYRLSFMKYSGTLVEESLLEQKEHDYLFFIGLPDSLRSSIGSTLKSVVLTRSGQKFEPWTNPASVSEVCAAVSEHYESCRIDTYRRRRKRAAVSDSESDSSDSATDSSDSEDAPYSSGDDVASPPKRKGKKKTRRDRLSSHSDSEVRSTRRGHKSTRREVKALRLQLELLKKQTSAPTHSDPGPLAPLAGPSSVYAGVHGTGNAPNPFAAGLPAGYPTAYAAQPNGPNAGPPGQRVCYMCGGVENNGLTHPLGMRNCPETTALIQERVLQYHPVTGMLERTDKGYLPRFNQLPQGLAAWMRSQSGNAQVLGATARATGLYLDDEPAFPYTGSYAFPAAASSFPVTTRSKAKAATSPSKTVRFEPTTLPTLPVATPAFPPSAPPPHFRNTEEGFMQEYRLKKHPATVEEVPDADAPRHHTFTRTTSKPFKFTSEVQQSVVVDDVHDRLLDSPVTMTLREALALAPSLQKKVAALVKPRRDFSGSDVPATASAFATDTTPASFIEEVPVTSEGFIPAGIRPRRLVVTVAMLRALACYRASASDNE
ncbi:uncharacterized protein BXZ73DRAFT_103338 [Epithele typhae]|uniref:uncharacterized protein n=1 Tax=Epithele typhae TaxID=378194 RepID=UPI00200757D1|nr:uncharacterized protein BXZ73DRAFT_103338 [Epithele typhae]KAH9924963.1 hypothetical protein BXZ73DRAFT_103338 [Epithele typhae]